MSSSVNNLVVPVSSTIPSTSGSTYCTGAPLYKVAPVTKILVEPCKALQSPFLVKRQSLRRPDAKILEGLYHDITTRSDMHEVEDIRKLVKVGETMNNVWLNFAVNNLGRDDARDFSNTKCLGWRHYVDSDWAIQSLKGALDPEDPKDIKNLFYRGSVLYNASQSHMIFIPVFHDAHWTLYAFNVYDQKLSILDSRPDTAEGGHDPMERHQKTRCDLCDALTVTMNSAIDFRSWEYEFPKLPREQNSNDSGFFVFNFMRLWDGHRLVRWFPIESRELRKDFLAYILSCKDNSIHMPERIYSKINYLPGKMMDCTMYKVAMEGRRLRTENQGDYGSVGSSNNASSAPAVNGNGPDVEAPDPESASSDFLSTCQRVTSDGDGVLHIAARFGNVELVHDILENHATLADVLLLAVNNRGDTTLHCAAARGSDKIVTRFLGHMFEGDTGEAISKLLRAQNLKGETCLHEAVRHGHVDIVRKLIDKDNEGEFGRRALVQIVDNEGISPLYLATSLRKIEIVKALIVHPASAAGPAGKTALHAAVVLLDKELVKILLEWNAVLTSQVDESGSTPLHFLASLSLRRREPNVIVFLLYKLQKYLNIVIKLLCCKPSQDPGIIELIMGKDPLSALYADCTGSMPIHIAAAYGRLDIVKKLLECCYCESLRNASGQTFLHVAVEKEKLDIVDYVCREKKFNRILNIEDQDGNTALHLAVNNASEKIVCTLMQNREVCLNFANKEGRTPLDLAFSSLHPKVICMKGPREWIFFDLLHGGGDFGVGGWDHLARDVVEPDWEKESERVGKSASMLAVCAVLILNVALLAPFNVIRDMGKDAPFNVVAFQIFVVSDSIAFVCSATATFTCARAGFTMFHGLTRLKNLISGTFALGMAALAMIITVALALFLVLPEGIGVLPIMTAGFGIFFHLVSFFVKSKIVSTVDHLRAVRARIGFPRLVCILLFQRSAIKPLWVVPSASTSLFWSVAFVLATFAMITSIKPKVAG